MDQIPPALGDDVEIDPSEILAPKEEISFLTEISNSIDGMLSSFIENTYQALVRENASTILLIFSLWIMFRAYQMYFDKITFKDFSSQFINSLLVVSFIFSFDFFSAYIVPLVTSIAPTLSKTLSSMVSIDNGYVDGNTTVKMLDNVLSYVWQTVLRLIEVSGWKAAFGAWIVSTIVLVCTALMTLGGFIIYQVSVITLALMLALTPIFVPMMLFERTRPMFDGFVTTIANQVVIQIMLGAVITLSTRIFIDFTSSQINGLGEGWLDYVGICFVVIFCASLIRSVPELASRITGSLSSGATGSGAAGSINNAGMSATKGAGKLATKGVVGAGKWAGKKLWGG
jgi:hypothetical protein